MSTDFEAGNLGEVLKLGHREQVASSQIISWGTGDLAPSEDSPIYPFEIVFSSGPKLGHVHKSP
jgi:hypothetical protein